MTSKLIMVIFRNLLRSKTRLIITILGCGLAAFVTCFFLSAEDSLTRMTAAAGKDANIIVRQKDRH